MKKTILVVLLTIAGFIPLWLYEPTPKASTAIVQQSTAPTTTSSGTPSDAKTVAGSAENTRWGPIQVQIVYSGSTITDIEVLQAPDDGPTNRALPTLREEALQAQSANIDTVSGATQTSRAYQKSLQAAIDSAGN